METFTNWHIVSVKPVRKGRATKKLSTWPKIEAIFRHGLQVKAKEILDCCPKWSGLKTKAEDNNYKNDGTRIMDRKLKMLQQKLLGLMKIYAIIHINLNNNEEVQQLGQKYFALLLEAEKWVITKRKEASLPGAIIPQDPQLFTQEDLKIDNQNQKFKHGHIKLTSHLGKVCHNFPLPQASQNLSSKEKVVFKDFKEEDLDTDHLMDLDISQN